MCVYIGVLEGFYRIFFGFHIFKHKKKSSKGDHAE